MNPEVQDPVVEPGAEPVVEPAEPAWAPSQEEWQQTVETLQRLAQIEQQRAQVYQPEGGEPTPQIDPFDPGFAEQLRGIVREEVAPFQQFQQETEFAEAHERGMDILGDLAAKGGDFDKELAWMRAEQMLPQMQQQYGFGPKAAEAALEKAAADQRAYEEAINQQAIAKYTNQLSTLSSAPIDPGSGYTVGVQQRTMPDFTKGGSVTSRFFGQNTEE